MLESDKERGEHPSLWHVLSRLWLRRAKQDGLDPEGRANCLGPRASHNRDAAECPELAAEAGLGRTRNYEGVI